MIIGITGTNGAGKGAVVEYLATDKGFTHYSSSGYLGMELERRGLEQTRTNLRMVGNEFREKYGSGYLSETFMNVAKKDGISNIVIESIRSIGEAQKIKDVGGFLVVVDAEKKLRYDRIFARRTGKDLIDFDTFVEQEEREWFGTEGAHDMNIRLVMEMGDYSISNSGTLEELKVQVEDMLQKLPGRRS